MESTINNLCRKVLKTYNSCKTLEQYNNAIKFHDLLIINYNVTDRAVIGILNYNKHIIKKRFYV